jgi:hypothetical protein
VRSAAARGPEGDRRPDDEAEAPRLKAFEGKRLPVGAKLTVQVTENGMIGVVKTLTIRNRKSPSVRTLCIPPGSTRPSTC